MPSAHPIFLTTAALAKRAGLFRDTAARHIRRGSIVIDGFLEYGRKPQPIFRPERVADLVRAEYSIPAEIPAAVATEREGGCAK